MNAKKAFKSIARRSIQMPRWLGRMLFRERLYRLHSWELFKSKLYYENLLRARCEKVGSGLMLFGEIPYILGNGKIYLGSQVELHDKITFFTSGDDSRNSTIRIGNNSGLMFMVQIRAQQLVEIGNHCMIASRSIINDSDGHPTHWRRRRDHLKPRPEDAKPVIIEDDVWVGENCIIMKGVHIGQGSIIAAGSVVTKNIPAFCVAAGVPARVLKELEQPSGEELDALRQENMTNPEADVG